MGVRGARGLDDLLEGRVGPAVAQVLEHRGVEQEGLLGDDRHQPAQRLARDLLERNAVELDRSARRLVEAEQQIGQRGLARARAADQGQALTGPQLEVDAPQHLLAPVAEDHVAVGDPLTQPLQVDGVRRVRGVLRQVEHVEDALRGGERVLQTVPVSGHVPRGPVEHGRDEEERRERTHRDAPEALDHAVHAHDQHHAEAGLAEKLDGGAREHAVAQHLHPAAEVAHQLSSVGLALLRLGVEGLDDLDAGEDLEQPLCHLCELDLASQGRLAHPAAEELDRKADRGRDKERHQSELPVQVEREAHGDGDREHVLNGLAEDQGLRLVRDVGVAQRARDKLAARVALVMGERDVQELRG